MNRRAQVTAITALAIAAGIVASGAAVAPSAVAAWTAAANAQFTQSSAIVPPVTFTSCATSAPRGDVTLTWSTAPASVNGSALKDYLVEWTYDTGAAIVTTAVTQPSYVGSQSGLTGTSSIRVSARYANGWNTLVPTSYPFTTRTGLNKAACNPDF